MSKVIKKMASITNRRGERVAISLMIRGEGKSITRFDMCYCDSAKALDAAAKFFKVSPEAAARHRLI